MINFTGYSWGEKQNILAPDGGYITVIWHLKNGLHDKAVLLHIATTNDKWAKSKLKELNDALD